MTSRLKDSSLVSSTSSKEELERFTLEALREYLKKHSLATTGTKEVIIKRIREQKDVEEEVESKENSHPNLSGILPILHSSITTSTPPPSISTSCAPHLLSFFLYLISILSFLNHTIFDDIRSFGEPECIWEVQQK